MIVLVAPGALKSRTLELVGHFLEDGRSELSLFERENSELSVPGGGGKVVGQCLVGPCNAGEGVVVVGHGLIRLDVVFVVVEVIVSSQKCHL